MQSNIVEMMETDFASPELSAAQFEKISQLVHQLCGINLQPGKKEELVKTRLIKRLRALRLSSFEEYLRYVRQDGTGQELSTMVDALTTNKTSFFREPQHFDYLREKILPELRSGTRRIRFWSAGCSSGEEPYTIAMLLRDELPKLSDCDVQILATDISTSMLRIARNAIYPKDTVTEVPPHLLAKHFTRFQARSQRVAQNGDHNAVSQVTERGLGDTYQIKNEVRALVRLARLNLIEPWPMRGPFDAIFCRNVMIYFEKPTQQQLVHRFCELLEPGGHFFVGHSESLTGLTHGFRYVCPAVYVKV